MAKEEILKQYLPTHEDIDLCGIKHIMTNEDAYAIVNCTIQKLLYARYPCRECGGKGQVPFKGAFTCGACNGTGKSDRPVFAVLAENGKIIGGHNETL